MLTVLVSSCAGDSPTEAPEQTTLAVEARTSGEDIDPGGYTVRVDGERPTPLGANSTVDFQVSTSITHSVELLGVAENCAIVGDNPKLVQVGFVPEAVTFEVQCEAFGSIAVSVRTTGVTLDWNGYEVRDDRGSKATSAANDDLLFPDKAAGSYMISIVDVEANCSASGPNPRSVSVSAGQTTNLTFDISCELALRDQIAFERLVRTFPSSEPDIYVINVDGSGLHNLTNHPAYDSDPAVSPGGHRIAFVSGRAGNYEIFVMKADGTDPRNLSNSPYSDYAPSWSPDGKQLAFVSNRDGDWELYVMNADGSDVRRLTQRPGKDWHPAWSPDGEQIAFAAGLSGEIFTVGVGGGSGTNISNDSSFDGGPAWSPDGKRIAFNSNRYGSDEILTMLPDGSGLRRLTNDPQGNDGWPSWSPSGDRLVVARMDRTLLSWGIAVVDSKTGRVTNITNTGDTDWHPSWSPLCSHLSC